MMKAMFALFVSLSVASAAHANGRTREPGNEKSVAQIYRELAALQADLEQAEKTRLVGTILTVSLATATILGFFGGRRVVRDLRDMRYPLPHAELAGGILIVVGGGATAHAAGKLFIPYQMVPVLRSFVEAKKLEFEAAIAVQDITQ